jgi:pilus assembly protein CpaC
MIFAGAFGGGGATRRELARLGRVLAAGFLLCASGSLTVLAKAPAKKGGEKTEEAARGIYHVQPSEDQIEVQVTLHKSETVRMGVPFSEALVGNPEVADVVPLTDRSIYIVGKKVGVTRLALLDQGKQLLATVDIEVTYDLAGLRRRVKANPALSRVKVQSVNGKILLTGVVPDAVAMQQVMNLAKQVSELEITNAMEVAAPQQVMLEVRFIEADRSASRALGVNAAVVGNRAAGITGTESFAGGIKEDSSGDFVNNLTNLAGAGLVNNAIPFCTLIGRVLAGGTQADIFVKALEERGLARRLAEPNLVALSGDTANFLAGGEFPFPSSSKDGEIEVTFKKFGIGLAFTPTVLAEGQINLKIEPEVSDLDPTNFVKVNGTEIPTLIVRRASTTVELRDGQSFAVAGLLQSNHIRNQRQLPWLGDVPILGALLRSAAWQKKETDLVIIVTPRLVRPRAPGQKIATPLDKTLSSNDKELFLLGKQEVNVGRPDSFTGHIIDLKNEDPAAGWKGTIK